MSLLNRPRRLRHNPTLRRMVRENHLRVDDLIAPFFIVEGTDIYNPISSMPGQAQISVDRLDAEIDELVELGVPAVLLFGIPLHKDAWGSSAWDANGPVPSAIRAIKERAPEMMVIADVCLCEYTDHGHCGILNLPADEQRQPIEAGEPPIRAYSPTLPDGYVRNDESRQLLGKASVAYAQAGVDIIAPSAMMDGQIEAIRTQLDQAGYEHVPIMSYAAKYASAFYGPFREAAESTPKFGDRQTYQMDPGNAREALREVELDVQEGADMLMVKPAGAYLDIIAATRQHFPHPLAAYQVSGEFAMIKAAAQNGWIDERRAAMESLIAIKRAGADMIITYYAKDVARWLNER